MTDKTPATTASPFSPNVFGDFRKEMDKMFERFFGDHEDTATRTGFPSLSMRGAVRPAIDISENDASITLTAELPGMTEDQVDVSVSDGVLTLKGEKKIEHMSDTDDVQLVERSYGAFQRSLSLPDRIDVDGISAKLDKGVLVVTMPKKPGSGNGTRKIAIGG